jgi:hypothetical protein
MIRSLLKLLAVAVVCILVYNYFGGTPEEKATSKQIFGQVGQVAKSVGGLIKAERGKITDGKYDAAIDKVTAAIQGLKKDAAATGDAATLQEIERIETRAEALQEESHAQGSGTSGTLEQRIEQAKKAKKGLDDLSAMLDALSGKMDAKTQE